MTQQIKITNSQDSVTIDIEGTIGVPEQWQFEEPQQRVATYETFRHTIQQIEQLESPKVVVNIRSTGGDVNDALLIYDALRSLSATITTRCYGYVASAATVIAQAASEGLREVSSNALYLIHNSQCAVEGSVQELTQRIELLKKTDERLSELYAERSGGDAATFVELMAEQSGAGRWLNAQETIEMGLADRIIELDTTQSDSDSADSTDKEGEGNKEDEISVIEKALSQVSNVVSRVGSHLKQMLLQDEAAESKGEMKQEVTPAATVSVAPKEVESQLINKSSQIAFEEGQKSFTRSEVVQREDPSLSEVRRSANFDAYSNDAKRLKR